MNRAVGYLGPILFAVGAWLASPKPHPVASDVVVLGTVAAAAVVGLVAVRLGSQIGVGLGLAAALAVTVPPLVPLAWSGPLLVVLGTALALEGASSSASDLPPAPLRAWGLPVALLLVATLVSLAALATQAGRESLDITQGIGVAVSAPFLLGAAWAGLRALERRGDGDASSILPAAAAVVLLAGGFLVAGAVPAEASHACEVPRSASSFDECTTDRHVKSEEGASFSVDGESWSLDANASDKLLVHPGFERRDISNFTFQRAVLDVGLQLHSPGSSCAGSTLAVDRALDEWDDDTTLSQVPDGTGARTVTLTDDDCNFGNTISVNVTGHFQAWADGAEIHGWRLYLTDGGVVDGRETPLNMNATYDVNPPSIANATLSPGAGDHEVAMLPVGENATVSANVTDPRDALRNASLDVDEQVHNQTLHEQGVTNVTFEVTEVSGNGTLELVVQDWDTNRDRVTVAEVRPDRETPEMAPGEDSPLETTDDGFDLPDPVPRGEDASVALNLSDDACDTVDACATLEVRRTNGSLVAERSIDASGQTVDVPLPTDAAGDHALFLNLTDPAERRNATLLTYRVSEPDAPVFEDVTVTDGLGREDRQEAGVPLNVAVDLDEESPPVAVSVAVGGEVLADATVTNTSASVTLRPVVEDPGSTPLTITAEDRWDNEASTGTTAEILPARDPILQLPNVTHIPSQARLEATVEDPSVPPGNVSVRVDRGGTPLQGATVDTRTVEEGVDVDVQLPELLHGESVRLTVSATDGLGRFATASSDHEVDAVGPDVHVTPSPGARIGPDLWTVPDGEVAVAASDDGSGVARVSLLEPFRRDLAATNTTLSARELGEGRLAVEAVDRVGNDENWTGTLRLDRQAPDVALDVDGHDLLATVREDGSGLARVQLTADGNPLSIPNVPGEHRVEVPGVVRSDAVQATLVAEDRVEQSASRTENVTIGDAPPEVRVSVPAERTVRLNPSDPDGDLVDLEARLTHLVNGTSVPLDTSGDQVTLPAWRGDAQLRVNATAHNASTLSTRTFTLGEGPFLDAGLPVDPEPGKETPVEVSWERAYEQVTLVVTRDGEQHAVAPVEEAASPGEGTATVTFDEEGRYSLELRAQHQDGTVDTASVGQVDVQSGPSTAFLVVGVLLLVALIGLVVLDRVQSDEDAEGPPPDEPA